MKIIQGERGFGKTTTLVKWLLDGEAVNHYPGWSRIIVGHSHNSVIFITDMIKSATQDEWSYLQDLEYDTMLEGTKLRYHELSDIRKAVWTLEEVRQKGRDWKGVDFAVDNLDILLSWMLGTAKAPALATVSDWTWEQLPNPKESKC